MGHRNQGIFSIEKKIAINRELTMTSMRLITIKYFNRLTALDSTHLWPGACIRRVHQVCAAGYLVDGLVELLLHGLVALLQQVVPLQQRLTDPSRQLQIPVALANHSREHRLKEGNVLTETVGGE